MTTPTTGAAELPEALRLADALCDGSYLLSVERYTTANELRRLHAQVEALSAAQAGVPADDGFNPVDGHIYQSNGHGTVKFVAVDYERGEPIYHFETSRGIRYMKREQMLRDIKEAAPPQPSPSPAPAEGNWIAADDVKRLVRELDVALNGKEGAAQQASLCDVVSQVVREAAKLGRPLIPAPAQPGQEGESVARVYTMEALVPGGSEKCHVTLLKPLPAGTLLYTAPPPQAVREPLTEARILEVVGLAPDRKVCASICMRAKFDKKPCQCYPTSASRSEVVAIARAVESAHGITKGAQHG